MERGACRGYGPWYRRGWDLAKTNTFLFLLRCKRLRIGFRHETRTGWMPWMSLGGVWRCSALKELDLLSRRQWAILRLVLLALTQYQIRALEERPCLSFAG